MNRQTIAGWRAAFLRLSRRAVLTARGAHDSAIAEAIRGFPPEQRRHKAPADFIPEDRWHSWDPTPWAHPWLTPDNLRAARSFGDAFIARLTAAHGAEPPAGSRYGFVGNLANNMALRGLPLRRRGVPITLYQHPSDRHVMSQPGWELSDAVLSSPETNIDRLSEHGFTLPAVEDSLTLPAPDQEWPRLAGEARETPATHWPPPGIPRFVNQLDALTWPSYFCYMPALEVLQSCSALFAAQTPYLAYLSHRPYVAAQTGGDLWLEASRQDALGTLQRRSYACASAILATNPWAYSNARRFGFRHVLYAPLIVDTDAYSPGPRDIREEWQARIGGDFFALITARLDRKWKGSHIGLEAFTACAARHSGARLILVGWGAHTEELMAELDDRGLAGRYLRLPTAGKRKLVDYLRGADCLIDQFAMGYYGATALEALAAGVPVVMRLARAQYDALCPTGAPPVLDADNAEQAARQLTLLAESGEQRRQCAEQSRRWVQLNHGVDVWRDRYVVLLKAAAARARFDFRESPLARPLTSVEREYHAAGLRAAPPFPQYEH